MRIEFLPIGIIRESLMESCKSGHITTDTYHICDNIMSQFLKLDEVLNITKDNNHYIWDTKN